MERPLSTNPLGHLFWAHHGRHQGAPERSTLGVTARYSTFAVCSPTIYDVSLKLYLVTCDLIHEGDYASLRSRLRTFEARPVLANQWALHSTHTATQLKDILKEFLHEGDRIVVTEVGAERASRRALSNLAEL